MIGQNRIPQFTPSDRSQAIDQAKNAPMRIGLLFRKETE